MFNTIAKAKLVYNKNKELYKLVVAFNVHKKVKDNGDVVYLFPVQSKCAYVSGDINYRDLQNDVARVLKHAEQQLRTDNIEMI